jgi:simple sugar transport system ATP-binding protein
MMGALSGGNQQKVVLARELWVTPKLLVAVQPTRGLDIAAVAAIHRRLLAARDAGAGVLLISLDLDEVLSLSDRVYVLAAGRITLELARGQLDERRIGRAMLGEANA